jgi:hypothetical protein
MNRASAADPPAGSSNRKNDSSANAGSAGGNVLELRPSSNMIPDTLHNRTMMSGGWRLLLSNNCGFVSLSTARLTKRGNANG